MVIEKDMSELTDEQIENNPELIITNAKNAVEALQGLFNNLRNISALVEAELTGSELLEQTDILQTLPRKLFDYLTIEYLREYFYKTYSALSLLGVIEINAISTVSNPFESPRVQQIFDWDRIGVLIRSPLTLLKNTIKDNDQ